MSAQPKESVITATTLGQYALIDSGDIGADLRYRWSETVGDSTRTMASFLLATDAIQMRRYFQEREDAEVKWRMKLEVKG